MRARSTDRSPLQLLCLGAVELRRADGETSTVLEIGPKSRALLAYLALAHPRDALHSRDVIAELFWPEQDQEHARSNLRKAVYELRRQVGSDALVTRGKEEIGLDRGSIWCDAVELDRLLDGDAIEAALDLYRGELLPGLHVSGCAGFERWLEGERTRIRRRVLEAIQRLTTEAEASGRLAEAARWYRRALEVDPYDEETGRKLVDATARLGDRAGAVQEYESLARRLREDLDLEPTDESRRLIARVRRPKLDAAPTRPQADALAARGEVSPEGARQPESVHGAESASSDRVRSSLERRPVRPLLAGVLVLAGLVGLYAVTRERGAGRPAGEARPGSAAPGIAVVPFRVNDPALESWSEGMVDLLSTNLDGAGGLRAIDSRTVLARWREAVPSGAKSDLATALRIARRTGAAYAVVGSAVLLDSDVRLIADVYGLDRGSRIGETQIAGPPDSVFALVDRLSIGILGSVLGDAAGRVPQPRLAGVTTNSLPGLRAFLEGERAYRRARFEEAAAAYKRAVEADSTFALCWYRLAQTNFWLEGDPGYAIDRALRLIERLPLREAMFVRAQRALLSGLGFRALQISRDAVAKHPDDSEGWYLLGEVYFHLGGPLLADPGEAEEALARAVELEPAFAPYRIHLLDRAFLTADSSAAAERLSVYTRLAPGAASVYRLRHALAFGDSASRSVAWAAIDTLETASLRTVHLGLRHARFLPQRERVLHRALARRDLGLRSFTTGELARTLVQQGKLRATVDRLGDSLLAPGLGAYLAYRLTRLDDVEPPENVLRALDLSSALDEPPYGRVFFAAAHTVDRQRWDEHARAVDSLRAIARELSSGDAIPVPIQTAEATALEGYGLWRRGRAREGLERLERSRQLSADWWRAGPVNATIRWWTGQLLWELGRKKDAIRYFESLVNHGFTFPSFDSYASSELGRLYEDVGETRKAIAAYSLALIAWQDADLEMRPRITAAEQAIARLSGEAEQPN